MRTILPLLSLALVLGAPGAAAACTLPDVCDAVADYELDRLFGDYTDFAVLFLGLLVAVAILSALVALIRTPFRGARIAATQREDVKSISPTETIQLIIDVENKRKRTSVDLALDLPEVPAGWTAVGFAASAYASGFTVPQAMPKDEILHLSSRVKGNNRGAVAVSLTAPADAPLDESQDVLLRLTPVVAGVPRPSHAKKHRFTLVVTRKHAAVQIESVTHIPEKLVPGRPVLTRAVLINGGTADAQEVPVQFLLNDEPLEQRVLPTLGVQQEAVVEFQWTPKAGENRIRINLAQ